MKPLQNRRSGLTLTELLVVVSIVVIVTAVLAPLLTSGLEGREVREAARQVNAYFQSARTRAKQLGRPVGVVIRRAENDPNKAYQLSLAEEIPPYRGFDEWSRALLDTSTEIVTLVATGAGAPQPEGFSVSEIQPNDEIRFNYRGPRFRIIAVNPRTSELRVLSDDATQRLPRVGEQTPLQYEIFRRPRLAVSTPLELPTGAAVFLNLSGVGLGTGNTTGSTRLDESALSGTDRPGYIGLIEFQAISESALADAPFNAPFNGARMPLAIMFNPTGEVGRIYRFLPPPNVAWPEYSLFPPKRPQGKIYLFLGKDNPEGALPELMDGTNLWVTIDPLSGSVTSAPNLFDPTLTVGDDVGEIVSSSRQLAATGQSVGGR